MIELPISTNDLYFIVKEKDPYMVDLIDEKLYSKDLAEKACIEKGYTKYIIISLEQWITNFSYTHY